MQHKGVVTGAIVRSENGGAREGISTIGVVAFFVGKVCTHAPVRIERVLYSAGSVKRIGSFVIGVDKSGRWVGSSINGLKGGGPPILCEIVIEQSEAGAEHRVAAGAGRIGDSQSRGELLAVVVRNTKREAQRRQQRIR